MPDQYIQIEGAEKLALLGKALRQAGPDRTIINALSKRIKGMAPEIRTAIKASAVETLPDRGGLGWWVSQARVNVSVTRGAKTAGVRIVDGRNSAQKRTDLASIDAGSLRHPLHGNRDHWYPQVIRAGFATRVVQGPIGDRFQAETVAAIDDAIGEVLHGI